VTASEVRFACHAVAAPLLNWLQTTRVTQATVLGTSSTSAYLSTGEFVIAITARQTPLMPNGAAVIQGSGLNAFERGTRARISTEQIGAGGVVVGLTHAERFELEVSRNEGHDTAAVARRGHDLIEALGREHGPDPMAVLARARPEFASGEGLVGVRSLLTALEQRDPKPAAEAASALTGRGRGLTPDGDDLLAAAAASIRAWAGPTGMSRDDAELLCARLLVDDLDRRTGALSATLLRLAAGGHVIDQVRSLLDLGASRAAWAKALARLERIGHGTGGTYALGCALSALVLTNGLQHDHHRIGV